jgi:maltose alpha-D-glucosyltransferase/alpha-amylase
VRDVLNLRRTHAALGTRGSVDVIHAGYPLVYRRGTQFLIAINPGAAPVEARIDAHPGILLIGDGTTYSAGTLALDGHAYAVYQSRRP